MANEGTSRFGLLSADAALTWPFKAASQNLRYNASLRLQDNTTPLTPQDRFAIGGRYTVRGFDGESSLPAERGILLRNDLSLALGSSGQEAYAGLDYGEVSGPSSELLVGKYLCGAVVGMRGSIKKTAIRPLRRWPREQAHGVQNSSGHCRIQCEPEFLIRNIAMLPSTFTIIAPAFNLPPHSDAEAFGSATWLWMHGSKQRKPINTPIKLLIKLSMRAIRGFCIPVRATLRVL